MLSIFKRCVQLFVSICLVVTLGGCGGPSEGVVKESLAAFFQSPGAEDFMELEDFTSEECELTQNEKSSKGLEERWVVRFTLVAEFNGKRQVDDSIKGAIMERTKEGDWYINPFKIFGC
ncbi:hypothetical protein [Herpetosiphon gulosus]|uniref:Lipoprotein n=1 Tax=Herpetosiphon gulosus TaxID=1973496 RepID=A0ABP9X1G0_9CHLR